MTHQLDWLTATRARDEALERCERVTSDAFRDGASRCITAYLGAHGPQSGELLVEKCKAFGYVPTDDRHFGVVLKKLVAQGKIRCVGYVMRAKGHGTAGGRVWELVR
jgi:hypothetical protein